MKDILKGIYGTLTVIGFVFIFILFILLFNGTINNWWFLGINAGYLALLLVISKYAYGKFGEHIQMYVLLNGVIILMQLIFIPFTTLLIVNAVYALTTIVLIIVFDDQFYKEPVKKKRR